MTLLNGALEARGKVLLKVNVTAANRDAVLAVLPSAKSPTVNQLANGDYAIESVVAQGRDQPRDPGADRRRRDRSARDPDQQDRALSDAGHGRASSTRRPGSA